MLLSSNYQYSTQHYCRSKECYYNPAATCSLYYDHISQTTNPIGLVNNLAFTGNRSLDEAHSYMHILFTND